MLYGRGQTSRRVPLLAGCLCDASLTHPTGMILSLTCRLRLVQVVMGEAGGTPRSLCVFDGEGDGCKLLACGTSQVSPS
jgi:hypothetical protein